MPDVKGIPIQQLEPHPRNKELYDASGAEDWTAFVQSIALNGVVEPLVVTAAPNPPGYVIVSGHRRFAAATELGLAELPCIVRGFASEDDLLAAIVEYNRYRDKTVSDKMREAKLLEEVEAHKARERMGAASSGRENLPELDKGRTRDKVAAAIGVSGRTYDKMKFIHDQAVANPAGTAARLLTRIDKGESSVDSVFKTLKAGENKTWLNFNPKVYDYWFFGSTDAKYGQPHPGQIHPGIVENLLWLYTKEGDLVIDPFAGGGITLDICSAWGRRCNTYDIDPRRAEVRQHDIKRGYPAECADADLVILDPPYWNMVAEEYSADGAASYNFGDFVEFLRFVAQDTMRTLKVGGHAAFIIMKQHYRLPPGIPMVDWPFIFYKFFVEAGGTPVQRIYNMWPTSIWQPFQVTTAKLDKRLLPIMGELCVFQKR